MYKIDANYKEWRLSQVFAVDGDYAPVYEVWREGAHG